VGQASRLEEVVRGAAARDLLVRKPPQRTAERDDHHLAHIWEQLAGGEPGVPARLNGRDARSSTK
jgi:hypothetical protein